MNTQMTIEGKAVMITGASRGLGLALVEEALRRGARRVYGASRGTTPHKDPRVKAITLDVTSTHDIAEALQTVDHLDVLINNAGVAVPDELNDRHAIEEHLAVNLFGGWAVSSTFLPLLERSGGVLVNVVSLAAIAAVPLQPAYSASKAAELSLTQSLRALWEPRGVRVHSVLPGPIDTEMTRDLPIPKAAPEAVASAIFDGVESGEQDIFPDPMAQAIGRGWIDSPVKEFERQNAALVRVRPLAA